MIIFLGVKKQFEETQNENLVLRKQLSQFLLSSQSPMPNRPTRTVSPPIPTTTSQTPPTNTTQMPPTNTPQMYPPTMPPPQNPSYSISPTSTFSAPPIPTSPIPSPYLTTSPTPPKTSPTQSPSVTRLASNPLSSAPPSHSLPPDSHPHFSQLGSQTSFGYTPQSPVQQQAPAKSTYNVTPVAQWPLPQGWDMSFDKGGRPYFINHANR